MAGEESGASGAPAEGQGAAPASPWAGLDPESSGWINNKQFKDVGSLVKGYRELESFRGVPAERLLKLPDKEDAPEWGEVHARLGRPEKPEGYEIDGADPELLAALHKEGVSKRAAKNLAAVIAARAQGQQTQQSEATQQEIQLAEQGLRREWGQEYEPNMNHGKTAVAAMFKDLGFAPEKVGDFLDAMQDSMVKIGHKPGEAYAAVMKTFARWGRGMAPATFVEGEPAGRGSGYGTTPEAAMSEFRRLGNDVEFMKKVDAGDVAAIDRYNRIAKLAAPLFNAGGPQH